MLVTSSKLSVFSFLIALFVCNHNRKKNALNSQKKMFFPDPLSFSEEDIQTEK